MAIGNIGDRVSSSSLAKLDSKDNKPESEPGFEDGFDFGVDFDSLTEDFGGGGDDGFSGGGMDDSMGATFGGGAGAMAAGMPGGMNMTGSLDLSNGNTMNRPVEQPPDIMDKAIEFSGEAFKASIQVVKETFASIKLRNYDDIASYSASMVIVGFAIAGVSLGLGLLGGISEVRAISFTGLAFPCIFAGLIDAAFGLIGIGLAGAGVLSKGGISSGIDDLPDIPIQNTTGSLTFEEDKAAMDDEQKYADLFEEMFSEEEAAAESFNNSWSDDSYSPPAYNDSGDDPFGLNNFNPEPEPEPEPTQEFNGEELLDKLPEHVPTLDRRHLYDTFSSFFPTNTPDFSKQVELDKDSEEFRGIRALMFEAMEAASKLEMDEINSDVESVMSSFFCYIIKFTRIKGLNKLDDIKREVEAFFRQDSEDESVTAKVSLEGSCYKIIITKGVKAIVTVGDCLQLPEVQKYMMDEKNAIPFVAGIDDYGQPLLVDGKNYTTLLIAGKQRSGKSWYVNSFLLTAMAFNSPDDVQFLIIDPKDSNLFKHVACMPHVCGRHNDKDILRILKEVIAKEGERRKKVLEEHTSDSIWDLRNRVGVKMPVLYIVIDEYMTVLANLGDKGAESELSRILNIVITQLPFVGIYLLIVPHRAQGVVDKTMRANVLFTAAIRASTEIVKETLDDPKWNRSLTEPGDTALRLADIGTTKAVKSAALTTSDIDNTRFIDNMAKAYYRIGVEIPDMRSIGYGYNRDIKQIKKILQIEDSSSTFVKMDGDNEIKESVSGFDSTFELDEPVLDIGEKPSGDSGDIKLHPTAENWDNDEWDVAPDVDGGMLF